MSHPDVEFLEIGEIDDRFDFRSLVFSSHIGFLRCLEFVELSSDDLVFYFLEEQCRLCQLMPRLEDIRFAQLVPFEGIDVEHFPQAFAAEGQERFEGDGEVGHQLERDIQDGLHPFRVGFPHFPRLTFRDIAVADTSQVHCLFLCLAELEHIEQALHVLLHILELLERGFVYLVEFTASGHHPTPVFLGELKRTVHEVAVDGHQFVVVAVLEILPSEVVVFGLRSVGGEHIAQHILFSRQVD